MNKYRVQLNDYDDIEIEADDYSITPDGYLKFDDEEANAIAAFKADTWEYVVKVDEKKKNKCGCGE